MMPSIKAEEIEKQKNKLSPEIFTFLIQSKATKACGCIENQNQKKICYSKYI